MNLALLDRYTLFLLDGLRQGGTIVTSQWTQEERLQAINNSYSEICKLIRRNRRDHFTRRRLSTDGVVFIRNQSFDCANFRALSGTATYTLPPDFLEFRGLRSTTSGRESVSFRNVDENDEEFRTRRRGLSGSNPTLPGIYWSDVIGERTLTLTPTPQETLDLELAYVAQVELLVLFRTGTCTVTNASTSVVFDTPIDERNSRVRPGDELLVGTALAQPTPDLTTRYHKLATLSAAGTTAGLGDAYLGATGGSLLYTMASVPQFHEDWHYAICHGAVWELLKAIEMGAEEAREAAFKNRDRIWGSLIPESAIRSSQEAETAEDGWSPFEG